MEKVEDKDMELEKAKQLLKELVTRDSEYRLHCENLPMQYTEILSAINNENLIGIKNQAKFAQVLIVGTTASARQF